MGCHFLLQRIFLTQESIPGLLCLLHCRQILYSVSHWGSQYKSTQLCILGTWWNLMMDPVLLRGLKVGSQLLILHWNACWQHSLQVGNHKIWVCTSALWLDSFRQLSWRLAACVWWVLPRGWSSAEMPELGVDAGGMSPNWLILS